MTHRIRFIERLRDNLHLSVDRIIDSLYKPDFKDTKTTIAQTKVDLERLQNQIKEDD